MIRTEMDIRELASELNVTLITVEHEYYSRIVTIKIRGRWKDCRLFRKLMQENCPKDTLFLIGRSWKFWK